ncbi:MAG: hypothetical protein AAFX99_03200, partial [Myxococcota bacterium]
ASHGAYLATQEQVPVKTTVVDDFGDDEEKIEWKEPTDFPVTGFHIGLDRAAPVGGLLFIGGAVLLFLGFRSGGEEASA